MSLHTLVREILDEERGEIDDANDIHKDWRKDIITEWRLGANVSEVIESFTNPVNDAAERVQFAIALESAYGPSERLNQLLADYWWLQITWRVDEAIMAAKSEHETTALIAREERGEQQAEWQRDRYLSAKEYAA